MVTRQNQSGDSTSDVTKQQQAQGSGATDFASHAREGAFGGPTDRTSTTQNADGTGWHTDSKGRVDAVTNVRGDTTHFTYDDKTNKVQSYQVTDRSGKVIATNHRDQQTGHFKVGEASYKDVQVGSAHQISFIDDNNVSHERLLAGNSIRVDRTMPRTADGSRPVLAEKSHDGSKTEYQYSVGSDGQKPVSQLQSFAAQAKSVDGKPGAYNEVGIYRQSADGTSGHWEIYKSVPGQPPMQPADVQNALKTGDTTNLQKYLDTDKLDTPKQIFVDNNGHRFERYPNGDEISTTSDGVVQHKLPDGRYTESQRGADGQPHLTHFESTDPGAGTVDIHYDSSGNIDRYSRRSIDPATQQQVFDSYTRKGNAFVDDSTGQLVQGPTDNKDGSVTFPAGNDLNFTYNDDGSEIRRDSKTGQIIGEITTGGTRITIKNDQAGKPNYIEYDYPHITYHNAISPDGQPQKATYDYPKNMQHMWQRQGDSDQWSDQAVAAIGYSGRQAHVEVDQYGGIHWKFTDGRLPHTDDPRDTPNLHAVRRPQPLRIQTRPNANQVWDPDGSRVPVYPRVPENFAQ